MSYEWSLPKLSKDNEQGKEIYDRMKDGGIIPENKSSGG